MIKDYAYWVGMLVLLLCLNIASATGWKPALGLVAGAFYGIGYALGSSRDDR